MHSSAEASINVAELAVVSHVDPFDPGISTSFSTSLPSQNLHGDNTGNDGVLGGRQRDWAIKLALMQEYHRQQYEKRK